MLLKNQILKFSFNLISYVSQPQDLILNDLDGYNKYITSVQRLFKLQMMS